VRTKIGLVVMGLLLSVSSVAQKKTTVWIVPPDSLPYAPFEFITAPPQKSASPPPGVKVTAGVLEWGRAKKRVEPVHPSRIGSGEVVVEIITDEKGNVISAVAESGDASFRQPAVDAARQWKFEPTKFDGVPVKALLRITFNF